MTDFTPTDIPAFGRARSDVLDSNFNAIQTAIASKANTASPTFTGPVTIPAGASIDGFAPLASPALTGVPTAPTAAPGTGTDQIATMAALVAQAFIAALPGQTGNAGKSIRTDGASASWGFPVTTHVAGTTVTAAAGDNLSLENVAATAVTANAAPADEEEFSVAANNGLRTNTVDFGAKTVRGPAGSLNIITLDTPYIPWRFKFFTTDNVWVLQ